MTYLLLNFPHSVEYSVFDRPGPAERNLYSVSFISLDARLLLFVTFEFPITGHEPFEEKINLVICLYQDIQLLRNEITYIKSTFNSSYDRNAQQRHGQLPLIQLNYAAGKRAVPTEFKTNTRNIGNCILIQRSIKRATIFEFGQYVLSSFSLSTQNGFQLYHEGKDHTVYTSSKDSDSPRKYARLMEINRIY